MINHKYVLTVAFVATAAVLMATILEFSYQAKALDVGTSTTCMTNKCTTQVYNSTSSPSFQKPSGYSTTCMNGKCHTEVFNSDDIS
jgi:hypothetical protein